MSNSKNDGGPAFPTQNGCEYAPGMSLRDYFAAAALPKLIEEVGFYWRKAWADKVKAEEMPWHEIDDLTDADWLSRNAEQAAIACYNFADEMLAARQE